MTSQHDKPKRWRPRFSVRTLVIVVTLVCCYASCWGPTKKYAGRPYGDGDFRVSTAIAPLLVATDDPILRLDSTGTMIAATERTYSIWFFGYVAKLPFERELPDCAWRDAWTSRQSRPQ